MIARHGASVRALARVAAAALGVAATLLVLGRLGDVAWGHGETTPTIRSIIDRIDPSGPGVRATTFPGLPTELLLANRSATELTVIGDEGDAFLRIGPGGVLANLNSATWYASGNPDGLAVTPDSAHRGAVPRWVRVSRNPTWAYFDRRLVPGRVPIPQEAVQGRRAVRLDSWSVPVRYGGRAGAIRGHVEYRPVVGAVVPELRSPPRPAPGLLVGVLNGPLPGFYVSNDGPTPVTVIGRDGAPFARIGPRGAEVNLHSPTYLDGLLADGRSPTVPIEPGARPLWRRVGDVPRFGWIDSRLRYAPEQPPGDAMRTDRRTVLSRWNVPVQDGPRRIELQGATSWIPAPVAGESTASDAAGGPGLGRWLAIGLPLVGLAALLAFAVRRRQAGAPLRRRRVERVR